MPLLLFLPLVGKTNILLGDIYVCVYLMVSGAGRGGSKQKPISGKGDTGNRENREQEIQRTWDRDGPF